MVSIRLPSTRVDADSCLIFRCTYQDMSSRYFSCNSVRLQSCPVITHRQLAAPQWHGSS
jgi:hypothetical protein